MTGESVANFASCVVVSLSGGVVIRTLDETRQNTLTQYRKRKLSPQDAPTILFFRTHMEETPSPKAQPLRVILHLSPFSASECLALLTHPSAVS
jgi:hypothetical protein